MYKIIARVALCLFLLMGIGKKINAQATSEYVRIIKRYEEWKADQFKKGNYATSKKCNDTVSIENYTGPEMGIPTEINISFADINNDNGMDALVTFHPDQCDGGNALMNAQIRVLILSTKKGYIVDDAFIDRIEKGLKKGWLSIEGFSYGSFFGTYFEYRKSDGRCCPSIRKPFTP